MSNNPERAAKTVDEDTTIREAVASHLANRLGKVWEWAVIVIHASDIAEDESIVVRPTDAR